MAREMSADTKRVFRAVVLVTWENGNTTTYVHGPYARKADASRMVTREKGSWRNSRGAAAGWVESADVEWKPVDA